MATIKFIQQLQSKTNSKLQLSKSCKLKNGKEIIEVILSIFQKTSIIIQIINLDLLGFYHYEIIYYSISLLYILLKNYIKYKNRNL